MKTLHQDLIVRIAATLVPAVLALSAAARAETTHPLRMIVPCEVGTPADLLARAMAKAMTEEQDQNVLVENHPSRAGDIDASARLPNDGRTIVLDLAGCGEEDGTPPLSTSKK